MDEFTTALKLKEPSNSGEALQNLVCWMRVVVTVERVMKTQQLSVDEEGMMSTLLKEAKERRDKAEALHQKLKANEANANANRGGGGGGDGDGSGGGGGSWWFWASRPRGGGYTTITEDKSTQ